jgi:hypothetical protein
MPAPLKTALHANGASMVLLPYDARHTYRTTMGGFPANVTPKMQTGRKTLFFLVLPTLSQDAERGGKRLQKIHAPEPSASPSKNKTNNTRRQADRDPCGRARA